MELGARFLKEGLTKFHFSRDDYGRTLATFLDNAQTSISIVSISLKITHEEGRLTDLFRKKLAQNENFVVKISLLNPNNDSLVEIAADTLNVSPKKLREEIADMLKALLDCQEQLMKSERERFIILVHNCFPMGSVLMLDTTPTGGMIQVETKLYKSPRNESFGFQLTKDGQFFTRHYTAWQKIFQDSKPFGKDDLIKRKGA